MRKAVLRRATMAVIAATLALDGPALAGPRQEGVVDGVRVWVRPSCPIVDSTRYKPAVQESALVALGVTILSQLAGAAVKSFGAALTSASSAKDLKASATTAFTHFALPKQVPEDLSTTVRFKYVADPGCIIFAKGKFGPSSTGKLDLGGLPAQMKNPPALDILRPEKEREGRLRELGLTETPELYAEFIVRPLIEGQNGEKKDLLSATDFEIRPALFWNRKPLSPGFGRSDAISLFDIVMTDQQPTAAAMPDKAVKFAARLTVGQVGSGAVVGPEGFDGISVAAPYPATGFSEDKFDTLRKAGWPRGVKPPGQPQTDAETTARAEFAKAYDDAAGREYAREYLTVTYTASYGDSPVLKAAGEAVTGSASAIADEVKKQLTAPPEPTIAQIGDYYVAFQDAETKRQAYQAAKDDPKTTPTDLASKQKDAVTASTTANTKAAAAGKPLPYPEFAH